MSTAIGTLPTTTPTPTSPTAPAPREARGGRTFLPEVQALRALAVSLVVAYHLRPDLLPGGYVGVDVFFVISGFLITGHMLREARSTGRLALARFWANRARRILPAALLVIAVTAVTATALVPVTGWRELTRQGVASVFYVQNWVLAADSVDYLAAENVATPFQHFWSLAVEEQFYLVWPLLLVGAMRVRWRAPVHARSAGTPVTLVLVVFCAVVLASFVWSAFASARDPAAYFTTTTRLWELGLGGVLAVVHRDRSRFVGARSVLALGGLAAVVGSAWLLTDETAFPGTAALAPVLGTAAVIAAGRTAGPGSLTWLVDRRWVQWLGNSSYSLYLWHFPVVVCFLAWKGRPPSALEAVGLVAMMLLAAAASYRWVEQPLRAARWARAAPWKVLTAAAVAMAVTGVVALVPALRSDAYDRAWRAAAAAVQVEPGSGFGADAVRDGTAPAFVTEDPVIVPSLASLRTELSPVFTRCSVGPEVPGTPSCEFGDPDADRTLALVGDSHVRMLGTPLTAIAKERGWRVVTYLHNSCPFSLEPRDIPSGDSCVAANRATLDALLAEAPDVVVTSYYTGSHFEDPDGAAEGFADAWRPLVGAGVRVVAVEDAPRPRKDVVECVADHPDDPAECAVPRRDALARHGLLAEAAALAGGVDVVDLEDRYCGARSCPAVVGNVMVYRDDNHVTDTYARSLQPYLEDALALDAAAR
ncbi:acyltransferase family protein [Isoptericola hypogeus]|uniref:Acyltransferase family protein n=1 Tax=Isoptericola hypogeus TaxID=300179 RepID=A0ABN2IRQ4_9MICO